MTDTNYMIAQFIQEYSTKGGAESVAYELQQAMCRQNLKMITVTGNNSTNDDINIIEISKLLKKIPTRGKFGKYIGRLVVVPLFTYLATKYIKNNVKPIKSFFGSPVFVLSHGDTLAGDALVIHAVNKASLQEKSKNGNYSWMLNPMHWWVSLRDRYMIGGLHYKKYIALSNRVAEEIHQLYSVPYDRINIIPNGVNLDKFHPIGLGRIKVRKELGIPTNANVLLFVGHEFERKGLMFVVEAMGKLSEDFHLIVVGNDNPESFASLATYGGYQDRIHFTGPRQDLPYIYRASDAFVFPTTYEAFGLVTMEALASGIPIFSTRVGGIEDYLIDGVNGKFIERDSDDIADKIKEAFSNNVEFNSLMNEARNTAMNYSWDKIAQLYYNMMLETKGIKN